MWIIFVWTKPLFISIPPYGFWRGSLHYFPFTCSGAQSECTHQLSSSIWRCRESVYPIFYLRSQPTFLCCARPWQPTRFYYCLLVWLGWLCSGLSMLFVKQNKTQENQESLPTHLRYELTTHFQLSINWICLVFAPDQLPMAGNDPDLGRPNIKCTDSHNQWSRAVSFWGEWRASCLT